MLAQDMLHRAMAQGLDIAGQTMSEVIPAQLELGSGPLSAQAHCVWAATYAADQWSSPDDPWRAEGAHFLAGLTAAELQQADKSGQDLVPAE